MNTKLKQVSEVTAMHVNSVRLMGMHVFLEQVKSIAFTA